MSNISAIAYFVLTLSISYAFIYPSIGDFSALISEKQKLQDSVTMVSDIEAKKSQLLTSFNNISAADQKDIETILPNSLDFVRLVSQIDAVAAKYGISIKEVSSKELSSSVGSSIESAQPPRPYSSSIIGFSFDASYDKFNAFVGDLEKSLRILDVRSAKITANDKGVYSYNVQFETYWLKQQ